VFGTGVLATLKVSFIVYFHNIVGMYCLTCLFTEAPSSGSASDGDGYGPSTSLDLSDHDGKKYWVRSGKCNFDILG